MAGRVFAAAGAVASSRAAAQQSLPLSDPEASPDTPDAAFADPGTATSAWPVLALDGWPRRRGERLAELHASFERAVRRGRNEPQDVEA